MSEIIAIVVTAITLTTVAAMKRDPDTGKLRWDNRANQFTIIFLAALVLSLVVAAGRTVHLMVNKSRAMRTLSEIRNIDLALTKVLSDAGRSNLREFFDPAAFDEACSAYMQARDVDIFEASTALYTQATYALLRHGRNALTEPADAGDDFRHHGSGTLRSDVLRNLGTHYYSDFGDDPWGNPYQFFAGPWPDVLGPVLLRTVCPNAASIQPSKASGSGVAMDSLTVSIAGDSSLSRGLSATARMAYYFWSFGANGISDQPHYDATHVYAPPARQHYREGAPDEYLGGGDDLNNWDKDSTFMWAYL